MMIIIIIKNYFDLKQLNIAILKGMEEADTYIAMTYANR